MKIKIVALLLAFTCLAFADTGRPVDPDLAKNALVVVRAKKISASEEADKFRWYEVEVIEVFENRAEQIFRWGPIKVAARSSDPGIPEGVSTLYIERYGDADAKLWKLVGGSATEGVSHTSK